MSAAPLPIASLQLHAELFLELDANRSAFEYSIIAHLFDEACLYATEHTRSLVDFACASVQGIYKLTELAKPDVKEKAARLYEGAVNAKRVRPFINRIDQADARRTKAYQDVSY